MPPGRNMATVLVVDDEPDILEVLQLTLEDAGYRVLTATDGAEALEAVRREIPDAMLLDVGMPNVDGWQVLEQIKSSGAGDLASVPVVMVTAWTSDEDRLRGGIEGAVYYLGKPFNPSEVVGVIDGLLAPDAPSEPELRRRVQQSSLERLARIERGDVADVASEVAGRTRVRLTRLDRLAEPVREEGLTAATLPDFVAGLSGRQRQIVELLLGGARVSDVASGLGVSRSNVYAVLRRVAKRAGVADGRALIHRLRRLSRD